MAGRWELENYPHNDRGDYLIVTDAIDEGLERYIVEDDIAEPAIYAQTIENVAKRLEKFEAALKQIAAFHPAKYPEVTSELTYQMGREDGRYDASVIALYALED